MKYDILVIDPPWPKKKGGLRAVRPNQKRCLDYKTMSFDDIFTFIDSSVIPLGAANHSIFMWNIEASLTRCDGAMDERGYRRHVRLVWDKGNGAAPCFTVRFSHEYLIWYYKGKFQPIQPACRGKFTTVFNESGREHSRKPDISYRMIDDMFPDKSKIDVFCREMRNGWDQIGDELNYFKGDIEL